MKSLNIDDVHEMLAIVTNAISPDDSQRIPERKRLLAEKLCKLIGADAYIWNACSIGHNGDVMATSVIEGGWPSQEQRQAVFELLSRTDVNQNTIAAVAPVIQSQKSKLLTMTEALTDAIGQEVNTRFAEIGLADILLHLYPVSLTSFSGIGLYRFEIKTPFTAREHALIELVMNHVDWLHRDGIREEAALESLELSPRERQVLVELLTGGTKLQVAANLQLSPHTVEDYIKAIYRKLSVNSRPELHALFHLGRVKHE